MREGLWPVKLYVSGFDITSFFCLIIYIADIIDPLRCHLIIVSSLFQHTKQHISAIIYFSFLLNSVQRDHVTFITSLLVFSWRCSCA